MCPYQPLQMGMEDGGQLEWCGLIFLIKGSLPSRQCPCTLTGGVHYSERDTSNFSPLKNISPDNMIRPGVDWEEGDLQLGTVFLLCEEHKMTWFSAMFLSKDLSVIYRSFSSLYLPSFTGCSPEALPSLPSLQQVLLRKCKWPHRS